MIGKGQVGGASLSPRASSFFRLCLAWPDNLSVLGPCCLEYNCLALAGGSSEPMGGELQVEEVRQGDRPDCCEGQKELGTERGLLEPGVQVPALPPTGVNWVIHFPLQASVSSSEQGHDTLGYRSCTLSITHQTSMSLPSSPGSGKLTSGGLDTGLLEAGEMALSSLIRPRGLACPYHIPAIRGICVNMWRAHGSISQSAGHSIHPPLFWKGQPPAPRACFHSSTPPMVRSRSGASPSCPLSGLTFSLCRGR